LVADIALKGLTLGVVGDTSTSTVAQDTAPGTGHLTFTSSDNTITGSGIVAYNQSSHTSTGTISGFCYAHAYYAGNNSQTCVYNGMAHNSWMGYRTQWGEMSAGSCKAMNCTHSAFNCSYRGTVIAQGSIAENSQYSFLCGNDSIMYTPDSRHIEGRTRMTNAANVEEGGGHSSHHHSPTWYSHPAGGDQNDNTWVARNSIGPATGYPTI